jgi:hypothetical protein
MTVAQRAECRVQREEGRAKSHHGCWTLKKGLAFLNFWGLIIAVFSSPPF